KIIKSRKIRRLHLSPKISKEKTIGQTVGYLFVILIVYKKYLQNAITILYNKFLWKEVNKMNNKDYTTSFTVDKTPEEAFAAINNVRGWWSGKIEGSADKLGDEFTYRYEDLHYSKQKVTEFVLGKKVVWHVVDASINFVKDKTEWKDTEITFEISKKDNKTEIRFSHVGLVPAI